MATTIPTRYDGSISFEEAQELARKHAKAEPESYYSEPFEPHLWVVNAVIEASATWYQRAVDERIRRVKAEARATLASTGAAANPASKQKPRLFCEGKGASDYCYHCGKDMCSGTSPSPPCRVLLAQHPEAVTAFGCSDATEDSSDGVPGKRCAQWCGSSSCPTATDNQNIK